MRTGPLQICNQLTGSHYTTAFLRFLFTRQKRYAGWFKENRTPSFIFGMTSVIQHRFDHSFTVTSRNLWRLNVKFFHPPYFHCVIILPSKTNTTANIGVKGFVLLTKLTNLSIVLK